MLNLVPVMPTMSQWLATVNARRVAEGWNDPTESKRASARGHKLPKRRKPFAGISTKPMWLWKGKSLRIYVPLDDERDYSVTHTTIYRAHIRGQRVVPTGITTPLRIAV